jgi:hypothetical protein
LEKMQKKSMRDRKKKDVKYAISSVVLNLLSIVLQAPASIARLFIPVNNLLVLIFFRKSRVEFQKLEFLLNSGTSLDKFNYN